MRPSFSLLLLLLLVLLSSCVIRRSGAGYLYKAAPGPPKGQTPGHSASGAAAGVLSTARAPGPSPLEWLQHIGSVLVDKASEAGTTAMAVAQTASDLELVNAMWKDAVALPYPLLNTLFKAGLASAAIVALGAGIRMWRGTGKRIIL
jgi:hypothetical protein